jgi:hypothetical protein
MRIAIVFPRRLLLRRIVPPCRAVAYATQTPIEDSKVTDATGNDRVRMTTAGARALGEAAMRGAGFADDDDARILTDHVLDAALCGYEYSGLPKRLNVVEYSDFRLPRRPVAVVRETGATAMLDGGNTTGMVAAYRAAEATIARAEANGLAIVCLANTWMTGRSAYYCEMIARAGLVVIHTVAAPPSRRPVRRRPAGAWQPTGSPSGFRPAVILLSSTWGRRHSWAPSCNFGPVSAHRFLRT